MQNEPIRIEDHELEDHDRGLAHDLKALTALASRRGALRWFAGAGTVAMVAACDSGSSTSGTVATPTPTPTSTATPSPTPSPAR